MHLAEGRLLEEALCDRGFLKGERDLSLFQDGLLLPDTKRKVTYIKRQQMIHLLPSRIIPDIPKPLALP